MCHGWDKISLQSHIHTTDTNLILWNTLILLGYAKLYIKTLICVPGMYVLLIIRFKMTKNLNGTDFLQLSLQVLVLVFFTFFSHVSPGSPLRYNGRYNGRPFPHMREVVHQMLRPTQLVFSLALCNMHILLCYWYGVCNTQQQIFFGDIFMVSPESRLQLKLMLQLTILKQLPSIVAVPWQ